MDTKTEKLLAHIGHELALLICVAIFHGLVGIYIAHKIMAANGVVTIKIEEIKHD